MLHTSTPPFHHKGSGETFGHIRRSDRHTRYLETGPGQPYIPIGLNLCFPRLAGTGEEGLALMRHWLDRLAESGGNYARLFLGHPFFDVEARRAGCFDESQAERIDAVLEHSRSVGIRLKLTIELFRSIGEKPQKESFPGAVNFSRTVYHPSNGGPFRDVGDFLDSPAGRRHFLSKLDWFAERYSAHPAVFGWELWNEMNAVEGKGWRDWTKVMLRELKARFPNHLTMQGLSSLDGDCGRPFYENIMPLDANEIAQVHRYLDLGASWKICHGPVDVMMADAVSLLRRIAPGKPVILSEGGAVEPCHIRPWDDYAKDHEGVVLHDVLFSAFFTGAAGGGIAGTGRNTSTGTTCGGISKGSPGPSKESIRSRSNSRHAAPIPVVCVSMPCAAGASASPGAATRRMTGQSN